jgi:hypothetical protein
MKPEYLDIVVDTYFIGSSGFAVGKNSRLVTILEHA